MPGPEVCQAVEVRATIAAVEREVSLVIGTEAGRRTRLNRLRVALFALERAPGPLEVSMRAFRAVLAEPLPPGHR
jgi:hypothetical protein